MKSKKKVAIIGTVGIPASYGGFETLTEHLVKQIGDRYDITVYCSKVSYPLEKRRKTFMGAKLKYLPLKANGIQSIPYDSLSILDAVRYADVLLILGVAGAWLLPFIKLFTKKKIIISIDGIEWKRDKWSKPAKWYLWWAENMAVKYSHADISDNESIQDYTAVRYGSLSNIIEYGANHTVPVKLSSNDKEMFPFLSKPYAFKVCRIEPENNIHLVLEAFSKMPKYTLVMIGNWNNSVYGKQLKVQYSNYSNIELLNPIYEQRKLDLIRSNAFLYVHGHSAGGTNPSLVEAMYLGLPIISFDVSYNRTTTEEQAFYFKDVKELMQIVEHTRISAFKEKSILMKQIADRRYTWEIIANKYAYLIERVLQNKKKVSVQSSIANLQDTGLYSLEIAHLKTTSLFYEKR